MHIKPECDVESLQDFAQYYESTYMESRDGAILRVSGTHGNNLVLRDIDRLDEEGEGYVLVPWSKVQTTLVYGRPPSGIFKHGTVVYYMYMTNNRMAGRGFRGDYYAYQSVRDGQALRWGNICRNENDLARSVLRPHYATIEHALANKLEDWLLSPIYSVSGERLFRRGQLVGYFEKDGLAMANGYPWVEKILRMQFNYKGKIRHADQ